MSEEFNLENMSPAFKQAYEFGVLKAKFASLQTSLALINEYVANWRTLSEDGRKRAFTAIEMTAAMQVYEAANLSVIRTREAAAKESQQAHTDAPVDMPIDAVRKLMAMLSDGGEYSICRHDGQPMGMGDAITIGDVLQPLETWLNAQDGAQ